MLNPVINVCILLSSNGQDHEFSPHKSGFDSQQECCFDGYICTIMLIRIVLVFCLKLILEATLTCVISNSNLLKVCIYLYQTWILYPLRK